MPPPDPPDKWPGFSVVSSPEATVFTVMLCHLIVSWLLDVDNRLAPYSTGFSKCCFCCPAETEINQMNFHSVAFLPQNPVDRWKSDCHASVAWICRDCEEVWRGNLYTESAMGRSGPKVVQFCFRGENQLFYRVCRKARYATQAAQSRISKLRLFN